MIDSIVEQLKEDDRRTWEHHSRNAERAQVARDQAVISSPRIQQNGKWLLDTETGLGTGADWRCPQWTVMGRCRKPVARIEGNSCFCTEGHESQ